MRFDSIKDAGGYYGFTGIISKIDGRRVQFHIEKRRLKKDEYLECEFSETDEMLNLNVGCPASTIFAGWRQSVLPVHLLGLAPLLGSVGPVAGDVKLQDDGVVHDPVNRRGGGHGVGKDALPLREDQV